jgi:hypothetical protein
VTSKQLTVVHVTIAHLCLPSCNAIEAGAK